MRPAPIVRATLAVALGCLTTAAAAADIETESVTYDVGDTEHSGFIARPADADGARPGVLVVHEWWGLDDHARNSAEKLAEAGYVALALDMYGDGSVADHPDEAGAMADEVRSNMDRMRERFDAAAELLRERSDVDADRIAAIGYCFGGGVVLQMARDGADLAGVASFHGSLASDEPAESGDIDAEILVLHGADDELVGDDQVEAFREEMDNAGADYELIEYDGAPHSFTNPEADKAAEEFGLPVGYDEEADRESWRELEGFLADVFE